MKKLLLILVLIAGGLVWFWFSGRKEVAEAPGPEISATATPEASEIVPDGKGGYQVINRLVIPQE